MKRLPNDYQDVQQALEALQYLKEVALDLKKADNRAIEVCYIKISVELERLYEYYSAVVSRSLDEEVV
jgi:hypothetical protein